MSKNVMETEGPQMTSQYGAYALRAGLPCTRPRVRVPTSTQAPASMHTYKYVILIAFPQQQWFRERASLLRNTYIVCLVVSCRAWSCRLFGKLALLTVFSRNTLRTKAVNETTDIQVSTPDTSFVRHARARAHTHTN
jgi:hypothetical protein